MNPAREQLKKRLLSLLWRAGAMGGVAALAYLSQNLGILELPQWLVAVLGLGLGELTKLLNNILTRSEITTIQ